METSYFDHALRAGTGLDIGDPNNPITVVSGRFVVLNRLSRTAHIDDPTEEIKRVGFHREILLITQQECEPVWDARSRTNRRLAKSRM